MKILFYVLATLAALAGLGTVAIANYGVWADVNLVDQGFVAGFTAFAFAMAAVCLYDLAGVGRR